MKQVIASVIAGATVMVLPLGCAAPGKVDKAILPGIVVEQGTQTLRIEGEVCIESGILEYLAVAKGGREYESVFSLHCRPSHLQAAMMIAGFEAGEVTPDLRGDFSPQADPAADIPPQGAPQVKRPPSEYFVAARADPRPEQLERRDVRTLGACCVCGSAARAC